MQISEDITVSLGTTSQVTTTWAVTRVTENTRRDTKSNEQDLVGHCSRLHISLHLRLHHTDIKWAKSQTGIG